VLAADAPAKAPAKAPANAPEKAPVTVAVDSWPAIEFGAHIRNATAGSHVKAHLEHADGVHTAIDWRRWCSRPDTADRSVLTRVEGMALDVGCGPGRLTVALAARGHAVLGIDVTPDAVSLTRAAGGVALHRSVFTHIPGEGRWDTVLLIDGNVGIGGNPVALLQRVKQLLAPSGRALVELDPPQTQGHVGPARIRRGDGVVTPWFPWARVPVATIGGIAGAAGFRTRESWCVDGRWFTALEPAARR
jgi:SAM-dependent methyltransferase